MADEITIKATEQKKFAPCPEGPQHAVCVDVIDLGETMESYQGNPPERKHKVALVFQTDIENDETGKRYEPSVEFTASFGPKANLRKFLGNWRGKPYSDEEAASSGAPLHKLVGVNAMLNVQHKVSKSERTYAVIAGIMPPIKSLPKLVPHNYERSEHWEKRKQEYRTLVAAHVGTPNTPLGAPNFEEMPEPLEPEGDDLPFNWER